MKAFHFTLEAVSTVRQMQEQKALDQYAQCLMTRRQAMEALNAVDRELATSWQEWRGRMEAGTTAADAAKSHAYHRTLAQRRSECVHGLDTAEGMVQAALRNMLAARQQREIVDKYFDKQKARHQREEVRGEQKFLDDLAGRRNQSVFAWRPV